MKHRGQILEIRDIIGLLQAPNDIKVRSIDWSDEEYIYFDRAANAILDNNGQEVNALTLVVNYEWQMFLPIN